MRRWARFGVASLLTLFVLAFCTAGIAGLFGALTTKAAPVH